MAISNYCYLRLCLSNTSSYFSSNIITNGLNFQDPHPQHLKPKQDWPAGYYLWQLKHRVFLKLPCISCRGYLVWLLLSSNTRWCRLSTFVVTSCTLMLDCTNDEHSSLIKICYLFGCLVYTISCICLHHSQIWLGYFSQVAILRNYYSGLHYTIYYLFYWFVPVRRAMFLLYRPLGPLNVGIPLFLDTPAPVNTQTLFAFIILLHTKAMDSFLGGATPSMGPPRGLNSEYISPAELMRASLSRSMHQFIFYDLASRSFFTSWIELI